MKTNWQPYINKDFLKLDNTYKVKLNNGEVKSISMRTVCTLYDTSHNEITTDDILFFAQKEDFNRYNSLQKHYELLNKYDFETLDNFEYAIYDTYKDEEDKKKIEKLFKKLKEHIEKAETLILEESKKYL